MNHLDDLKQLAIRSYHGTSFDSERRGESTIKEFNDLLNSDLEEIKNASEEQKQDYIRKFRSLFSSWLSAQSRCVSSMIAGPANFPVRRMQKYNDWEQKKYEAFNYWRVKAKRAIKKSNQPEVNALDEARRQLEQRKNLQDLYKKLNAAHIAYGKKGIEALDQFDLTEDQKRTVVNYIPVYSWEPHPIAPYQFTNNLANIKRLEGRVKELETREYNAENKETKVIPFNGGNILINYAIDRIQIKHDSKPEYSVISNLKHGGFKWSPSQMAWQRQLTVNAIWRTEELTGVKLR